MASNRTLVGPERSNHCGVETEDALFELLEQSYALGSSRDLLISPDAEEQQDLAEQRKWLDGLRFTKMDDLRVEERWLLARSKFNATQAREAGARHDFPQAWSYLAKAESLWKNEGLCRQAQLLGRVESLAAEAVIEYQACEYLRSHALLRQASHTDQELGECFGSQHSSVHAVHLLGKYIQLESAKRHYSRALSIAAAALIVLSGRSTKLDIDLWLSTPALIAQIPWSVRRMLSRQIVVEVGAALLFAPPAEAHPALHAFYADLGGAIDGSHIDLVAQQWLRAKYLSLDTCAFQAHLRAWCVLFLNSRQSAETLWLLGALDAAWRCGSTSHPGAQRFRRQVFGDLAAHTPFPSSLRTSWLRLST